MCRFSDGRRARAADGTPIVYDGPVAYYRHFVERPGPRRPAIRSHREEPVCRPPSPATPSSRARTAAASRAAGSSAACVSHPSQAAPERPRLPAPRCRRQRCRRARDRLYPPLLVRVRRYGHRRPVRWHVRRAGPLRHLRHRGHRLHHRYGRRHHPGHPPAELRPLRLPEPLVPAVLRRGRRGGVLFRQAGHLPGPHCGSCS